MNMRYEIVVASGKGGTGKTFISSNLAYFLKYKLNEEVVCADADVEAPDLIIALGGIEETIQRQKFYGLKFPKIDEEKCIKCLKCLEVCKYNAISLKDNKLIVDYDKCEGLGICAMFCPVNAISLFEKDIGEVIVALSKEKLLVVTGDLYVGYGNSGRLVYEVKRIARTYCSKLNAKYLVIDAAPGIGCPVVSSIVDADKVIIVVEPTLQSIKGATRLIQLVSQINLNYGVIINKYDLNKELSKQIEDKFEVIGKIPYSYDVVMSYSFMKPLLKLKPNSKVSRILEEIFLKIFG